MTEPSSGTKSGLQWQRTKLKNETQWSDKWGVEYLCMMPTVGSREIENPQVFAGDPIYLLIAMRGAPKKTGTMKFIIPDN